MKIKVTFWWLYFSCLFRKTRLKSAQKKKMGTDLANPKEICTFARVMRLSEKIVSVVLVLLAIVLAVLCVRSVWFTQEAADKQEQQMYHGRY